jgi:hypothetical protein
VATSVQVKLHGRHVKAQERKGAGRGVKKAAGHLLAAAKAIVPLEEGTLERSGEVTVAASELAAAVSFSTPYAVRQHEELDYRHAPGRQAKYLEEPYFAERGTMDALIAAEIRREMQGPR